MSLLIGPTDDIAGCLELRRVVFMLEQGVSEEEERDGCDDSAHHILARLDGQPVGCARILIEGDKGKIGRVCVLADQRGTGLGKALIEGCLAHLTSLGLTRAVLGAQTHALGFYEALGFTAFGEEFDDAGIPHRMMERGL
ncbi:MAG: GNAT family N-acetyltransferase [Pseudomonadota bacterium]